MFNLKEKWKISPQIDLLHAFSGFRKNNQDLFMRNPCACCANHQDLFISDIVHDVQKA